MSALTCQNDGHRAIISSNRSAPDMMVALLRAAFDLAEPRLVPSSSFPFPDSYHHEYLVDDVLKEAEAKAFFGQGIGTMSLHRGRNFFFFARVTGPNVVSVEMDTYEGAPVAAVVEKASHLLQTDERWSVHF